MQAARSSTRQKKAKAINYDLTAQQLAEIEQSFGALLKQLPNRAEMDALLTDINQAGLGRGLQFELFKPAAQERMADFYAELPINIRITGNYHDMGAFASDIAQLPRIVTLNDVAITNDKRHADHGRRREDLPLPRRGGGRQAARARPRKRRRAARNEALRCALGLAAARCARRLRRREPPGPARLDGRAGQGPARASSTRCRR